MLVGTPAVNQAVTNPENTITKAKRKMGTNYVYKIQGKEYKPQQISAFILQKIKKDSEAFTGDKITKAVITVPAYFNNEQRQATKDAGTIAGLEVARIINEPTAASLAFGLDKATLDMKILVFDFGGGTLDVTLMEMGGGVFEVISTSGDTHLGGTDMDLAIMDYVREEFRKKEGVDLSSDKKAMERLRAACEKAKIELSGVMETEINLPYIHEKTALVVKLTRAKLESLVTSLVERCKPSIDKSLEDAKISASDITKIVLVGGPTRMQIVKKFVGEVTHSNLGLELAHIISKEYKSKIKVVRGVTQSPETEVEIVNRINDVMIDLDLKKIQFEKVYPKTKNMLVSSELLKNFNKVKSGVLILGAGNQADAAFSPKTLELADKSKKTVFIVRSHLISEFHTRSFFNILLQIIKENKILYRIYIEILASISFIKSKQKIGRYDEEYFESKSQ